jgi:hypothetical protein
LPAASQTNDSTARWNSACKNLLPPQAFASRRHAEELITSGRVTVNGKIVDTLGAKADPETDHIKVNGRLINPQLKPRDKVYVLLNKPKGYLSSLADPKGRPLVTDLVPKGAGAGASCRSFRFQHRRLAAVDERRRLYELRYFCAQPHTQSIQGES